MTEVQARLASSKGGVFTYEERESLFAKRLEEISAELALSEAPKFAADESYHFSFFTPRFSWNFDEEKARVAEKGGLGRALYMGKRLKAYFEHCHDFGENESFFEMAIEICETVNCEEAIFIPSANVPDFLLLVKIVFSQLPDLAFSPYKAELQQMGFHNHIVVFARSVERLSSLEGNGESPKKAIFDEMKKQLEQIRNQVDDEFLPDEVGGVESMSQKIKVEEDRYTISKEVAAKALGISEKTLINWVSEAKKSGAELDWVKRVNGLKWVIVKDVFEEWLRSRDNKKKGRPAKGLKSPR